MRGILVRCKKDQERNPRTLKCVKRCKSTHTRNPVNFSCRKKCSNEMRMPDTSRDYTVRKGRCVLSKNARKLRCEEAGKEFVSGACVTRCPDTHERINGRCTRKVSEAARCTCKTRSNARCKRAALRGSVFCRNHGPNGPADNPVNIDAAGSKELPPEEPAQEDDLPLDPEFPEQHDELDVGESSEERLKDELRREDDEIPKQESASPNSFDVDNNEILNFNADDEIIGFPELESASPNSFDVDNNEILNFNADDEIAGFPELESASPKSFDGDNNDDMNGDFFENGQQDESDDIGESDEERLKNEYVRSDSWRRSDLGAKPTAPLHEPPVERDKDRMRRINNLCIRFADREEIPTPEDQLIEFIKNRKNLMSDKCLAPFRKKLGGTFNKGKDLAGMMLNKMKLYWNNNFVLFEKPLD